MAESTMMKKQRGLTRLVNAVVNSKRGLAQAYLSEAAFRQEVHAAVVLVLVALVVNVSAVERALLLASVFLVLIVEILNTAIEAAVDRIGYEIHELSGLAKDLGSAAVSLSLVLWFLVWVCILGPLFIELYK